MSGLTRRGFLSVFGSMTAAAVALPLVDLDKLLWVPGAKTIFLPPLGNRFVSPEWIAEEWARTMKNNLAFVKHVNRQYDVGFRVGDIVTINGKFERNPLARVKRLQRFAITSVAESGVINLRVAGGD